MKSILLTVLAVAVILAFSAPTGFAGAAKNIPICHIPPGNLAAAHEIDIDESAVDTHILNPSHCAINPEDGRTICDYELDGPLNCDVVNGNPQHESDCPCGGAI